MEKRKRLYPEEDKGDKEGDGIECKEEKKKRGRPKTRASNLTPAENKNAKRRKMQSKREHSKGNKVLLGKAIEAARHFAPTVPSQASQGDRVSFQSFRIGMLEFSFAFKWVQYGKEDVRAIDALKAMKINRQTTHLAVPKAIVPIPKFFPPMFIEIYKQYKETLTDAMLRDKPVPLDHARKYLKGILDGLATLHASNYIHGDLKPANIAITASGIVKLIDYGNMIKVREVDAHSSGNQYYSSEFFMTPKLHELYSVGCIFMEMLLPDWRMSGDQLSKEREVKQGKTMLARQYGKDVTDITELLTRRSDRSITAQKMLNHVFLGGPGTTYDLSTKAKKKTPPWPPSSAITRKVASSSHL